MDTQRSILAGQTQALAHRVYADQLVGAIGKSLVVGEGQQAVVTRKGQAEVLPPGSHRLAWLWGGAPDDIVLVETAPVPLHPSAGGLLSGDDQSMEADFLVRARVTDARKLAQTMGDRERLTAGELAGRIAAEAQGALGAAMRRFAAADLCSSSTVAQQIAGQLYGFVAAYLESAGVEVQQVSHFSCRRAADAARQAEEARQLRERLQTTEMQDRLSRIKSEKDFSDAIQALDQEYNIRSILRDDELNELKDNVLSKKPEQAPATGQQIAQILDQKLAGRDEQLVGRFEQMLNKLGYHSSVAHSGAILTLQRWVRVLQAAGTLVVAGTPLLTYLMPEFFVDPTLPRIITMAAGFLVAILAFGSAIWVSARASAQQAAEHKQMEEGRVGPERRQVTEKMVRAQVAGGLEQVGRNLDTAWQRAFRGDLQDLATPLRLLAKSASKAADDVRAANYEASLLTSGTLSPADLGTMVELNEALLQQGETLASTSQGIYNAVIANSRDDVTSGMKSFEVGLQNLRTTLIKKNSYLKGV